MRYLTLLPTAALLVTLAVLIIHFGWHGQISGEISSSVAPAEQLTELTVTPSKLSLGRRRLGETLKLTLEVSNTAKSECTISNIATSCGCTSVTENRFRLLPGERRMLPITIYTTHRDPGEFVTLITFHGELDARKISLEVPIRGELYKHAPLCCEPTSIWLGLLSPGQLVETQFTLKSESTFEPSTVRLDLPSWLSAILSESTPRRAIFKVTGKVPFETGALRAAIGITAGELDAETELHGTVAADVEFEIERLVRIVPYSADVVERVILRHRKGKDFILENVEFVGDYEYVDCSYADLTPSQKSVTVNIQAGPSKISGSRAIRGKVRASCCINGEDLTVNLPIVIVKLHEKETTNSHLIGNNESP